jgi:integrase
MVEVHRVRVVGPLDPYAAGFAAELERLGYTVFSARGQLGLIAHLSRWLAGAGLDAAGLSPAVVARFLVVRRAAGYAAYRSPKALSPLLGYLRGLGVAPWPVAPEPEGPGELLLERYRRYLLGERGLGAPTVRGYVHLVRPFVLGRATAESVDVAGLSASDVVGFVLAVSGQRPPKTAQRTVSALRSLLRFCHVEGLLAVPLAGAVPSVANRRAGLPRFLEPAQVQAPLGSCDRGTVAGRRDFAMMTMMVRLGLRAGEIAALCLGDIDWRRGEISIVGKGPRRERLPSLHRCGGGCRGLPAARPSRDCPGPAGVRPGQGPAPRPDPGWGHPGGGRRGRSGRAGPDHRAPAATHRSQRDAARRGHADPGRAGAAAPPRVDHRGLHQSGSLRNAPGTPRTGSGRCRSTPTHAWSAPTRRP